MGLWRGGDACLWLTMEPPLISTASRYRATLPLSALSRHMMYIFSPSSFEDFPVLASRHPSSLRVGDHEFVRTIQTSIYQK